MSEYREQIGEIVMPQPDRMIANREPDVMPATLDALASVLLRLPASALRKIKGVGDGNYTDEMFRESLLDWAEQHSQQPLADQRHFNQTAAKDPLHLDE